MLSLEQSGLRTPGIKAGCRGDPAKRVPPILALLPGSASPTRLCLDLKLPSAARSPVRSVSLARAGTCGSRSPQGPGVLFLTLGCSQQKERDGPDAHHLQYIQTVIGLIKRCQGNKQTQGCQAIRPASSPQIAGERQRELTLSDGPGFLSLWSQCPGWLLYPSFIV